MNLLFIDDDVQFTKLIEKDMFAYFSEFSDKINIYKYNDNFTDIVLNNNFDFAFIDIDLKSANGFDIATMIMESNPKCFLVFVSNKTNLVHFSMIHQPFFFIRKINYKNDLKIFFYLVEKFVEKNRFIDLNYKYVKARINVKNIICIEVKQHQLIIYSNDNIYYDNRTLKKFMTVINDINFIQIHKSYVINLNYLKSFKQSGLVVLSNDMVLNIGRTYRKEFINSYEDFLVR